MRLCLIVSLLWLFILAVPGCNNRESSYELAGYRLISPYSSNYGLVSPTSEVVLGPRIVSAGTTGTAIFGKKEKFSLRNSDFKFAQDEMTGYFIFDLPTENVTFYQSVEEFEEALKSNFKGLLSD